MENKITNKLNGVFEIDETYENNNWIRTKIRTFAFGKNRNGSDILNSSLTNFSKAHSTIGAVPIVAKYNDETDNLEGHNATLRKNKNGEYEIFYDTDALGFTSPTSTFYFEEVNEGNDENPDYKTYVVVEDVYLWKRFDATNKIIEWLQEGIAPRVSMEIDHVEGQFDKDGYFQIHDFEFAGIAALGSDVEPCFPRAEIQLYTVSDFRKDLKDLMSELNYNTKQEGGKEMEDIQVTQEQEFEATEETEVVETVEDVAEQVEAQEETEEATETDTEQEFEQAKTTEELQVEVSADTEETQEEVETETVEEVEAVNYEAKFNELSELFTSLQQELDELKSYKRKREEDDLKDKFEGKLSEEEFSEVFTSMKEAELDKVEKELFALIGKKNFSIQKPKTDVNKVKVVSPKKDDSVQSPYGDIFDEE